MGYRDIDNTSSSKIFSSSNTNLLWKATEKSYESVPLGLMVIMLSLCQTVYVYTCTLCKEYGGGKN